MIYSESTFVKGTALDFLERMDSGEADMFYMDPPWNFNSSFEEDQHINLEYIFKVLQQAKRILNDSGCLFLYSTPARNTDFQLLLREVFGATNFVSEFVVPFKSRSNLSGINQKHETLILYSKSNKVDLNYRVIERNVSEIEMLFPFVDEKGRFRKDTLFSPNTNRSILSYTWNGITPPAGKQWRYSSERLNELNKDGLLIKADNSEGVYLKRHMTSDEVYKTIGTIWDDLNLTGNTNSITAYNSALNFSIAERAILIGAPVGGLVVDPFCGTGSSYLAACENKRVWVGCESTATIQQVFLERTADAVVQPTVMDESKLLKHPVISNTYLKLYPTDEDFLMDLIVKGESETMEFKASAYVNIFTNKPDSSLAENVVHSVAAFLNSYLGGTLLIGVKNDGTFNDLANEYHVADKKKANQDGYALSLSSKIQALLGGPALGLYKITFVNINGNNICKIDIKPAKEPVYLKGNFTVRTNNQSCSLSCEDFLPYVKQRFNL